MQPKSLSSNIVTAGVAIILGGVLSAAAFAAEPKTFQLGIRLADGSYCSTQLGTARSTPLANSSVGTILYSTWATDTNGYDPDCMHLDLQMGSASLSSDFRVCLRFADSAVLDKNGNVDRLSQYGTLQCTPWASEGGGWSKIATDSNGYDWDAAQVAIETRTLPTGATISDFRIGARLCDKACTTQFGTAQFTPWASAGGGKSAWFGDGNWYDSDGGQIALEINKEIVGCKETIPESERVRADLLTTGPSFKAGLGDAGAASGWVVGGSNAVINSLQLKNGFDDRMVNTINWIGTQNLLVGSGTALRVPYAGNQQIVTCPTNQVAVGLDLYRGGGDKHETALICKPVVPGTVNFAAAKEYSINGCGQAYCTPYYNFPTTGYVMVGGRFNTDNHKYLGSIVVAPVITATERPATCPVETPPTPNPTPTSTPNPTPTSTPPGSGTNSNPPAATCTLSATPATIVLNIGSSQLSWNCSATGPVTISAVDNAEFMTVTNQPAQGSLQVAPSKTTTFKVTSSNASATATVTVGGSQFDETGGL